MKTTGGLFKQLLVIMLIVVSVYLSEGAMGFRPLINIEAFVLVFGGAFFLTWAAYPLKEMFRPSGPKVILHAAGCATAMGALTTVLNLMLMLSVADNVMELLRRTSLALSGLFFGLLLSKVILAPIAARLTVSGNLD